MEAIEKKVVRMWNQEGKTVADISYELSIVPQLVESILKEWDRGNRSEKH